MGTTTTAAPTTASSVLIVEDEGSIRDILTELFEVEGTEAVAVETLGEARDALARGGFDLIVTDIRLGGKRDGGLQVMATAGLLSPDATIIVLTAYPEEDVRHAALRLGATHFLEKPVDLSTIAALAGRHGIPTAITPSPVLSAASAAPAATDAARPAV